METRPFGKTGETFPILSFGGQRIVDTHGCTEEAAIEIVNTAIDRGIRYFDTAWIHSDDRRRAPVFFQRHHHVGAAGKNSLEGGRLG